MCQLQSVLGAGLVTVVLTAPIVHAGDLNLTVYNDDLALIRDTRTLELVEGVNEIRLQDVSARIDPTSVLLAGEGLAVLEQNFEFDLAGGDRILERYLDRDVMVVMESGEMHSGALASFAGGSLVLIDEGRTTVLTRDRVERIEFPELPGGLTTRPTLVWRLASDADGERETTISYLSGGLSWHAEYVAMVDQADEALSLSAWVSLQNVSGATYEDARLQLVAGDVNRVRDDRRTYVRGGRAPEADMMMKVEEEAFFEYHLYTVDTPVTVRDRQTKQITLFPTAEVGSVKKEYVYRGGDRASVTLAFENTEPNQLGIALPRGKVRVYKADSRGGAQFVGEDRIDHTPRDERIELTLGEAFDVVGERTMVEQRRISRRVVEHDVRIELRNRKDEDIEIRVEEPAWGEWSIVRSTHDWERENARQVVFRVPVAAGEVAALIYTIRIES